MSKKGFTLIELSIVIVIIGLIVAGVVGGQALVKQAQLRKIITEVNQYKTAYNAFRLQYSAFPGDMSNARSYWSSCGGSADECNGDGDKLIENNNSEANNEYLRAWQHLNLAGIVPGSYSGEGTDGADETTGGVNAPKSKLSGGIYTLREDAALTTGFGIPSTNYLFLGAYRTGNQAHLELLTPTQAKSIDSKADDGFPQSGFIYGTEDGAGTECVTAAPGNSTTPYKVTNEAAACVLEVKL